MHRRLFLKELLFLVHCDRHRVCVEVAHPVTCGPLVQYLNMVILGHRHQMFLLDVWLLAAKDVPWSSIEVDKSNVLDHLKPLKPSSTPCFPTLMMFKYLHVGNLELNEFRSVYKFVFVSMSSI